MTTSMTLEDWQQQGKWFSYQGHSIFSRLQGQGEPLVLIHGFPTASWDWHALWPTLSENYFLITLDMIGFGFSDKPAGYDYSLVDQADMIVGFLTELGVPSCHLLCHDYGNSVGQELLARQLEGSLPLKLHSIAFLNGALFPETQRPVLVQRLLMSPAGSLVSRLITQGTFNRNMKRIFGPETQPSDDMLDQLWRLLEYNNGRGVMHRIIHYMEERRCMRPRWVGALQKADIPLALIDGVDDPVSGGHMVDRFEELIGSENVIRLDGIGHYPQLEAPERVLSALAAFFHGIHAP